MYTGQCKNPLNEVYDPSLGQCTILVGSVCRENEGPNCVKNAKCTAPTARKKKHPWTCQCLKEFSVTPLNTCKLDIGEPCGPNECNQFNALVCINGTCNCLDAHLSYDKSDRSCKSLAGFPCGRVNLYTEPTQSSLEQESKQLNQIQVFCEAKSVCTDVMRTGKFLDGFEKKICKPV